MLDTSTSQTLFPKLYCKPYDTRALVQSIYYHGTREDCMQPSKPKNKMFKFFSVWEFKKTKGKKVKSSYSMISHSGTQMHDTNVHEGRFLL